MAYKNKEDQRASSRRHYEQNKEAMKARAREYTDQQRIRLKAYTTEVKESSPCCGCGVSFPACAMDFDHRDPSQKKDHVSRMVNQGVSLKTLQAEIAKCDLVCANCHRIRTFIAE